ncbi:MAG: trypsin-like peptidase domain-containing protein [Planctomycetota bacterium]
MTLSRQTFSRMAVFLVLATVAAIPTSAQDQLSRKEKKKVLSQAKNLSIAFNLAAEAVRPCTVQVYSRGNEGEVDPILKILGDQNPQQAQSFGTGVIISQDGYILTNHHVVKDAESTEIKLTDGRRFEVLDTKSDPSSDLAVLKVDGKNLPFVEASTVEPYVGEWVLAIGNPFMLDSSVSAGIISSTKRFRRLSPLVQGQFLQTDASVNPGNSGGPLIDLDGKLIGINTAIATRSGSFEGIGFAIPIKRANWIRTELVEHGKVRRGYAGVRTSNISFSQVQDLDLPGPLGALVRAVVPDYPAKKAGLQTNDVIISMDNEAIESAADFSNVVQQSPIGRPLELIIIRGGERKELSIKLEERL